MALDIIQSLWVEGPLSPMERLTINSYLKNGHKFHLYVYNDVTNIPIGTIIKDANEIIPNSDIFKVREGYSSFSDFFRWKLILDRGGWWSDLDAVCLRPLDFKTEYVFVGGAGLAGSDDCVSSGIFKAPKGAPILKSCWEICQTMNSKLMGWGVAGPPLITTQVHNFGFLKYIIPGRLFFPIFYTDAPQVFIKAGGPQIPEDAYSIHLFNEMWRMGHQSKTDTYPATSIYEQLKTRWGA